MQRTPLGPFLDQLRRILPSGWTVALSDLETAESRRAADTVLAIAAPDGTEALLLVETKVRLSAQQAAVLGPSLAEAVEADRWQGAIVFTRFASQMARERLRSAAVSFLDSTGNAWISLSRPAVFVERQGAETDPDPPRREVQSLKGAKAARIVRGLCDWRPPLGVRELARRTGANPGYVTRVLSLLEEEDVIARGDRGKVIEVRWQDLLRLWSRDYSVAGTNRAVPYLAPRGLPQLRDRLASFDDRYAVTGQFAVPPEAEVAPGRVLSCYVTSAEMAAKELDLRPTQSGANVVLLEPFDELVFERARESEGLVTVAMTQCVVDLLTGGGREPAQADALMSWMEQNEDAWRT